MNDGGLDHARREGGYGPARFRWRTFGVVLIGHAAVIGLLLAAAPDLLRQPVERKLTVFDVRLAPPPPAAWPDLPPPPVRPIAPVPIIATVQARPTVIVAPTPLPEPPPPAPSPPTPAREPAPPAPPVPPAPPREVARDLVATVLSAPPPRYPIASRRAREEGIVVLALRVGTDGRVEVIAISRGSGSSRSDDAALSAVRRWRWSPTIVAGQPVTVRGLVEIPFVLR